MTYVSPHWEHINPINAVRSALSPLETKYIDDSIAEMGRKNRLAVNTIQVLKQIKRRLLATGVLVEPKTIRRFS